MAEYVLRNRLVVFTILDLSRWRVNVPYMGTSRCGYVGPRRIPRVDCPFGHIFSLVEQDQFSILPHGGCEHVCRRLWVDKN